jgi:DNA-directed RNA polymerase subunit RPC12/RpoP
MYHSSYPLNIYAHPILLQKGHLTQHLMIHAGGRPHVCHLCSKTFIFKFDLNRHMKIHAERGIQCDQCGRAFLKQAELDAHEGTATFGLSAMLSHEFIASVCDGKPFDGIAHAEAELRAQEAQDVASMVKNEHGLLGASSTRLGSGGDGSPPPPTATGGSGKRKSGEHTCFTKLGFTQKTLQHPSPQVAAH